MLIYPVTDCDFARRSHEAYGTGLPLTALDMRWFFGHCAREELWQRPQISPLRDPYPADLPPALIVTAECDVLADDGRAYAERLKQASASSIARSRA